MKLFTIKTIFLTLCIVSVLISQHILTNDHHTQKKEYSVIVTPHFRITNDICETLIIEKDFNKLSIFGIVRELIYYVIGNIITVEPYSYIDVAINPQSTVDLVLRIPYNSCPLECKAAKETEYAQAKQNILLSHYLLPSN